MRMTPGAWQAHNTATTCHICLQDLDLAGDSVRDQCHITGQYRGAAHNACNLKLRLNPKTTVVPVVFHYLRGYDSHLLIQAISKVEGNVSCIPNSTEKVSFSLGQLRYIDSAQFLLASFDKLVAANRPEAFQITRNTSWTRQDANWSCARVCTPTSTWTPERALRRHSSHSRRPSTAKLLKDYDQHLSSRRGYVEAAQWSQSAMPKPTILWSRATTQKSQVATSSTWTRIIFMAEVDLKYHRELHKPINAYPLGPERMVVQKDWVRLPVRPSWRRDGANRGWEAGPKSP